eukprot:CAMPEP_0185771918 /NCGR_PEP_ID=MMETSP1174-20130828/65949_1 /TAXON_ID=35687 /ORGANISM="Dictyocha speculum, Strain CCMP1381" /LENGTH=277 /DNA_ID=CAMNT_0028457945 /DNA_START=31 /DNA_END=864 /DNA_ORIENTATION=+
MNFGGGNGFYDDSTTTNNEGAPGGGFLSQNPDMSGSGGQKNTNRQTLASVTIRQLLDANQESPDDTFRIDGADVHMVSVVANILNISEQATFITYGLEDTTGSINAKQFIDTDDEHQAKARASFREGVYVKIIGVLRVYNDEKHLTAYDIRLVEDHNMVTHHFLEAIYTHMTRTKGPQPQGGGSSQYSKPSTARSNLNSDMSAVKDNTNSPLMEKIQEIFRQNGGNDDDDQGLNVMQVVAALPGHQETEIRRTIRELSDEGWLYSTIDEEHFKSTDC